MIGSVRAALLATMLISGAADGRAQEAAEGPRWYTLGDGEFTIDMPGKPEHERSRPGGGPVYDAYRVTAGGVNYLLLIRAINVSRDPKALRELSIKGHAIGYTASLMDDARLLGVKAEVVFERDLSLAGFPGRQYRVNSDRGGGVIRFYATNHSLYTVQALGAGAADKTVAEFLNSFRFKRRRGD